MSKLYLYFLILFVSLSKGAKIYLIDIEDDRFERLNPDITHNKLKEHLYPTETEHRRPHHKSLMNHLMSELNNKKKKQINTSKRRKTTCDRHFGSMFGTKLQKLQCIQELNQNKKKQLPVERTVKLFPKIVFDNESDERFKFKYLSQHFDNTENAKDQFIQDFTRGNAQIIKFSEDYLDVNDLARSDVSNKKFASDYVDFDDLRRLGSHNMPLEYLDLFNTNEHLKGNTDTPENCALSRRSSRMGLHLVIPKGNTDTKEVVRATSDESSDSGDESPEEKKIQQKKKYQKLKRFQVIKNSESTEYAPKPVASSESDGASSVQASLEVPPKKNKKKTKEKPPSFSDVDDKYIYVQGRNRHVDLNTISDADSDDDARRRMQHFFPKRYHWNEEDIPNLGYYWFDGIKGKYASPWPVDRN